MSKSHVATGLDQLGPKRWISEDEQKHLRKLHEPRLRSLNERAAISAGQRLVTVTLPRLKFMEDDA